MPPNIDSNYLYITTEWTEPISASQSEARPPISGFVRTLRVIHQDSYRHI